MKKRSLLTLIILLSIANLSFAEKTSFYGMEKLIGVWVLEAPTSEREKNLQFNYHLISGDSALVEVYGDPQRQTTETIFHRDGKKLLATHYCAQGNQPRLKATLIEQKKIEFKFHDITNLKHKNDPHLVRLSFQWLDKNRVQKTEVYRVNGKDEVTHLSLIPATTN